MRQFVEAVVAKFGAADICVTNAGGPPAKGFLAASVEDWHKAIEANFMSTVHFAREVIPHMQRRRWGRIITITSITTKQPVADLVLSNAVRAAVVGLVKSLANEFGKDGILVNNVGPGFTATDRLKELAKSRSAASGTAEKEIFDGWAADAPCAAWENRGKLLTPSFGWLRSAHRTLPDRPCWWTGECIKGCNKCFMSRP